VSWKRRNPEVVVVVVAVVVVVVLVVDAVLSWDFLRRRVSD